MAVNINKGRALSTLSLTPLIDVVFLLLIFFLVATRFEEEERSMDIDLAQSSESSPLTAQPKTIFISIDSQGTYDLGGQQVTLEQMLEYLQKNNMQPVVLRPDRNTPYEYVVRANEACLKAGCRDIKQSTLPPGQQP